MIYLLNLRHCSRLLESSLQSVENQNTCSLQSVENRNTYLLIQDWMVVSYPKIRLKNPTSILFPCRGLTVFEQFLFENLTSRPKSFFFVSSQKGCCFDAATTFQNLIYPPKKMKMKNSFFNLKIGPTKFNDLDGQIYRVTYLIHWRCS